MKLFKTKKKCTFKKQPQFSSTTINLFWDNVHVRGRDDCWEHSGISCTINTKRWKVGRVSWIIRFGKIPKGMDVRKTCRNQKCVNPNHLYLKPSTIDNTPFLERFWNSIKKTNGGCWEWTGRKAKEGYGLISDKGVCHRANRVSYKIHKGEIPEGLIICHKCNNPECTNPDHLYAGTPKENTADMMRALRHPMGETNFNAVLTEKEVLSIRREYVPRKVTCEMLAKKYNVSKSTIRAVIARRAWKHV